MITDHSVYSECSPRFTDFWRETVVRTPSRNQREAVTPGAASLRRRLSARLREVRRHYVTDFP